MTCLPNQSVCCFLSVTAGTVSVQPSAVELQPAMLVTHITLLLVMHIIPLEDTFDAHSVKVFVSVVGVVVVAGT